MRWILIFASLFFCQLHAQNVTLSLVENSIKLNNDSLYFKYKIHNNSSSTLTFYNVRLFNIEISMPSQFRNIKKKLPGLLVKIIDKNNKLPNKITLSTARLSHYEKSIDKSSYNKYVILKPNESIGYDYLLYIGNIGSMVEGKYKLQLEYFSNNYYKYKFQKAKQRDKRLKNSVMFSDTINSNICSFTYPR